MKNIRIFVILFFLFGVDIPLGHALVGTNVFKGRTANQPRINEEGQSALGFEIARRGRSRRRGFKKFKFKKLKFGRRRGSRRSSSSIRR